LPSVDRTGIIQVDSPARSGVHQRGPIVSEIIFVVEEAPEGGFNARALNVSVFTQADTVEALREAVRDAVRCHFDEADLPRVIRLHFVRDEVIAA